MTNHNESPTYVCVCINKRQTNRPTERLILAAGFSKQTKSTNLYSLRGNKAFHPSSSSFVCHHQMSSSVAYSHALVSGPTSKRPASEGGLYKGQAVIMWSAVCSGSPHSHAAPSARPHFLMDALKQPTPVRRRFSRVHCRRGSSSPLMPPPGSWM